MIHVTWFQWPILTRPLQFMGTVRTLDVTVKGMVGWVARTDSDTQGYTGTAVFSVMRLSLRSWALWPVNIELWPVMAPVIRWTNPSNYLLYLWWLLLLLCDSAAADIEVSSHVYRQRDWRWQDNNRSWAPVITCAVVTSSGAVWWGKMPCLRELGVSVKDESCYGKVPAHVELERST